MFNKIIKTILLITILSIPGYSQVVVTADGEKYDKLKVSVAYSNIRSDDVTFFGTPVSITEAHGLTVALDYKLFSGNHYRLGAVAELTKNLNRTTFYDYLFGTQLSFPVLNNKVEPFVKATFGVHQLELDNVDRIPVPTFTQKHQSSFTTKQFAHSIGVGIDVNISKHFFVRPIQVERFAIDETIGNSTKISSGFGIKF